MSLAGCSDSAGDGKTDSYVFKRKVYAYEEKILKGVGILVMAGCLMTTMVKNAGAAENPVSDVVNEGNTSGSEGKGGQSDTKGGAGNEDDAGRNSAGNGSDRNTDDSGNGDGASGDGELKESETEQEESLPEKSLPEETLPEQTKPEETIAETQAANAAKQKEKEYLAMKDIAGTWTIDEGTSYSFNADGTWALILPKKRYSFKYTLEENEMKVDFENKRLRDSTFKVSMMDDALTLQCEDEYFENEFSLEKLED